MSLKCSVLGHAYGEPEVERDRQEEGSEVVITIREVEVCDRCGDERIVSENKEVTAIETPDEAVAGEAVAGEDDAADEGAADADAGEGPSPGTGEADLGAETDLGATDADAGADDAEILDAETTDPVDDELADPSVDAETDVGAGEPPETGAAGDAAGADGADDAVIIDDDGGDGGDEGGREPGAWPEEPDDGDDDWTPDIEAEEVQETEEATITVPEGEFHCPECGYTTPVEESSLRRGDFCPECRRGTLRHAGDGTRKE